VQNKDVAMREKYTKCTQNVRKIRKNQAIWPEKSEKNALKMHSKPKMTQIRK
jgi:hypothetical protein